MGISNKTLVAVSKKVGGNFKAKYKLVSEATTVKKVAPIAAPEPIAPVVEQSLVVPEPPKVEAVIVDTEPVVDPAAPAVQVINNHEETPPAV